MSDSFKFNENEQCNNGVNTFCLFTLRRFPFQFVSGKKSKKNVHKQKVEETKRICRTFPASFFLLLRRDGLKKSLRRHWI